MTVKADPGSKSQNFSDKDVSASLQPAANRGTSEASEPGAQEFPVGDRGVHSGVNKKQMEDASGTPGKAAKP